jgi:hypothetical protein
MTFCTPTKNAPFLLVSKRFSANFRPFLGLFERFQRNRSLASKSVIAIRRKLILNAGPAKLN